MEAYSEVKPGSVVWNQERAPDRVFVRCADGWVYFNRMTVSPFGNKDAVELFKVLFKAPSSKLLGKSAVKFNLI